MSQIVNNLIAPLNFENYYKHEEETPCCICHKKGDGSMIGHKNVKAINPSEIDCLVHHVHSQCFKKQSRQQQKKCSECGIKVDGSKVLTLGDRIRKELYENKEYILDRLQIAPVFFTTIMVLASLLFSLPQEDMEAFSVTSWSWVGSTLCSIILIGTFAELADRANFQKRMELEYGIGNRERSARRLFENYQHKVNALATWITPLPFVYNIYHSTPLFSFSKALFFGVATKIVTTRVSRFCLTKFSDFLHNLNYGETDLLPSRSQVAYSSH